MTTALALKACALVAAGVAAGLSGSVTGLASVITYPALLATGLSPIGANVTNTVALVFGGVGSVTASGPELEGQWQRIRGLLLASVIGGAIGAALLLVTTSSSFKLIVPWLVGGSALAVLFARPVAPQQQARRGLQVPRAALGGALIVGVYGGYFGAGAGVMMIVLYEAMLVGAFARLNAVKNLSLTLSNLVAAVIFVFASPVDWRAALPLAIGFFCGGRLGPRLVRVVPVRGLKLVICVFGLGLAIWLGVDAY